MRPILAFSALYLIYAFAALGAVRDPVMTFVLFPLFGLFLGFLESAEWVRAHAKV